MKRLIILAILMFSALASAQPSLLQQVQTEQGNKVTLEEFKGKVVYVDFWASWCGPCRKSFPWMNAMHAKYAQQGLAIVAINLDNDTSLAKQFLEKLPADFAIRYDPEGQASEAFNLLGMPSSFIFNKQGELVQTHVGFFTEDSDRYEQELRALLEE
ncbi:TlpA family protein disulfide reductase [Shewanella sp. AS1]|uniref:TlpA disulfide reductase family protein n=1 Tax=Shewanella sp. AS1 TaxID=2907626 RepID=UPI001F1D835B|nr:TlpA disulfide reductase family protein [Shewanella sp. AS1]MCE9680241.1 TlpA family protein disulfide reductase [Shewanella sp. AS1]